MALVNLVTDIKFEKSHLVFNVGERIRGVLFLAAKEGRELSRLFDLKLKLTHQIRYCGLAFDPEETSPLCSHDFTEQENPLILRPASVASDLTLELPFSILIDPSLFSTFVCRYGWIRYYLNLSGDIMAQGWRRRDEVYLNRLIVIIGQAAPRSLQVCKSSTYQSKAGEEVKLKVTLDSSIATVGQGLGFSVEVTNGLKIPLNMIKFVLKQNISSRFYYPGISLRPRLDNTDAKILVGKEGPQIPPGPERRVKWDGVIAIPFVVPSGLGLSKCPNFDVEYVLTFCLQRFVNLRVSFPIVVQSAGTQEESERNFEIESAYSLELSREFSASQFSLSSEASDGPSLWTSVIDIQSGQDEVRGGGRGGRRSSVPASLGTGPPSYQSDWGSVSNLSTASSGRSTQELVRLRHHIHKSLGLQLQMRGQRKNK